MTLQTAIKKMKEAFKELEETDSVKSIFFSIASEKQINNRAIVSSKINSTEDHLATIREITDEKLEEFDDKKEKGRNRMVG